MKSKKNKKNLLIIATAGLVILNLTVAQSRVNNKSQLKLSSLFLMSQAVAEDGVIPACVETYFFPDNWVKNDSQSVCRLSDGTACGLQETCNYEVGGGNCQATYCTSGG